MVPVRITTVFLVTAVLAGASTARGAPPLEPPDSPAADIAAVVKAAHGEPHGPLASPSPEELARTRALARTLTERASRGDVDDADIVAREAESLGFEMYVPPASSGPLIVLRDAAGRGLLILRVGEVTAPVVLQAPHSFHDIGTGQLAAELMARSDLRALVVNTRHRNAGGADAGQPPPTDVAHCAESAFHALTQGVLDALERPLLVQLHGFGRETVPDAAVDVVASCGAAARPAVLEAFVAAFVEVEPDLGVARYPADISLLGGTTNVQGRLILGRPEAAFLHLEFSPEARKVLLDDPSRQDALRDALVAAADTLE